MRQDIYALNESLLHCTVDTLSGVDRECRPNIPVRFLQSGAKYVEAIVLTEGKLCHQIKNGSCDFPSLPLPSSFGQPDQFDMSCTQPSQESRIYTEGRGSGGERWSLRIVFMSKRKLVPRSSKMSQPFCFRL